MARQVKTATRKKEADSFNLMDIVREQANQINPDEYPHERINSMALNIQRTNNKELFNNLLVLMYKIHGVELRIRETVEGGNKVYLSEEDYFQLYGTTLWECILSYNPNSDVVANYQFQLFESENDEKERNFDNYFIKTFHWKFLDEKKSSFLKVHGHVKKSERKIVKIKSIHAFADVLGKDVAYEFENDSMVSEIHELLDFLLNSEEKKIIQILFFAKKPNGKYFTEAEASAILGMDKNKLHAIKMRALRKVKNFSPNLAEDYYYHRDSSIVEALPTDAFDDDSAAA